MRLAHALLCAGVPCINETLRFLACSNAYVLPMIRFKNLSHPPRTALRYDVCNLGELIPIQESGINLYDVTKQCTVPLTHSLTADTTPTDGRPHKRTPTKKQTAFRLPRFIRSNRGGRMDCVWTCRWVGTARTESIAGVVQRYCCTLTRTVACALSPFQ